MKKVLAAFYLLVFLFINVSSSGAAKDQCVKPENKLLFTEQEVFLIKHTMSNTYREVYKNGHIFIGDLLIDYAGDLLDECEYKSFRYKMGLSYE